MENEDTYKVYVLSPTSKGIWELFYRAYIVNVYEDGTLILRDKVSGQLITVAVYAPGQWLSCELIRED